MSTEHRPAARWHRRRGWLLVALLLTLMVGGWRMLGLERRFIYFPSREVGPSLADFGLQGEEFRVATPDGERLHGLYLRRDPATTTRPTLLFAHGNAGTAPDRLPRAAQWLQRLDVDVVLYDYRGYGQSSGSPSEQGTYTDARTVYDWLRQRGVAAERIVLFGESLGCAVSIQLALDRPVRGVILEAPFLSIRAMAKRLLPWLPLGPLLRTRYDNQAKIGRVEAPVFIVHGSDDELIPQEQGAALFAAAREPKRFLSVPGAHHNDVPLVGGASYLDALDAFLRSLDRR